MNNTESEQLRTQCHRAASIIVDALMMAGLLKQLDADQAVGIVEEEIIVRKAMHKL